MPFVYISLYIFFHDIVQMKNLSNFLHLHVKIQYYTVDNGILRAVLQNLQ